MIGAQKRSIELERFKLLLCIAALFFQDDKSLEPIFLQRVIWQHCNAYLPLVSLPDIQQTLDPLGVMVVIEAQHMCMQMRGVEKQNSITTTSDFTGAFNQAKTREEFMNLIQHGTTL